MLLRAMEGGKTLKERELSGGSAETTNNKMELMAAIMALETLERPSTVTVVTDSAYVKNGITQWITGWKRNGWKTAAKKPVKNQDLWQALDAATEGREINWRWVKGHAGDPGNERADALARAGLASPHAGESGGLSGAPLFEASTAVLRRLAQLTDRRIPLVGVGGVSTAEQAYAKIRAGASLVQLYTAMVYEGVRQH